MPSLQVPFRPSRCTRLAEPPLAPMAVLVLAAGGDSDESDVDFDAGGGAESSSGGEEDASGSDAEMVAEEGGCSFVPLTLTRLPGLRTSASLL